jgi:hypothetical protein
MAPGCSSRPTPFYDPPRTPASVQLSQRGRHRHVNRAKHFACAPSKLSPQPEALALEIYLYLLHPLQVPNNVPPFEVLATLAQARLQLITQ